MPHTTSEGAAIHWRARGTKTGTPLVLLHSIGTDQSVHAEVAPLLEPDFNMVLMDIRGHGGSGASPGDYSMALLARDVLAVMDDAGFGKAIVCGTSLGGMIAMELVRLAPERVSGLVLACTSARMSPALWPERIATVREKGLASAMDGWAARHLSETWMAANPERVADLERKYLATDPAGYIGNAAAIRDMDLLPGLPDIRVPVTVIAGKLDIATPFEGHGDQIAAAIEGAEVALLPAGHLACIEWPDLFAQSVRSLAVRCN